MSLARVGRYVVDVRRDAYGRAHSRVVAMVTCHRGAVRLTAPVEVAVANVEARAAASQQRGGSVDAAG